MATVTGQGTTFNLPNYVGELFAVTPTDTPFLSAIGGLTGGEEANATLFGWQGVDLRDADKTRQRVEGAGAPTPENRARFSITNVVEIHHETIEVSYSKLAATGQFHSTGSTHPGSIGIAGTTAMLNELDWQVIQALMQVARDVEKGFINGRFNNPPDNTEARSTRGIMEATTTNVVDQGLIVGDGASTIAADGTTTETAHSLVVGDIVVARTLTGDAIGVLDEDQAYHVVATPTADTFQVSKAPGGPVLTYPGPTGTADFYTTALLTEAMILDLLETIWLQGGISEAETSALIVNADLKRKLTKIFVTDKGYQEESRDLAGVNLRTIGTDFGALNIMLNRHMPTAALQVVSLDQCAPVFLPIPDKGFLFVEPLAKQGGVERSQIYGEIGLKYGNERAHGKLLAVRP